MFRFVILLAIVACVLSSAIPEGMVRLSDHPAGRIVGGKATTVSSFPWQVSVQRYNSHTCGGTIYNSNVIVTAAHCLQSVYASALRIRVGSSYWHEGGLVIPIQTFLIHEGYNRTSHVNDIAVIKLAKSLSFSSTVRPIGLATAAPKNGALATVSGWGKLSSGSRGLPNQLQYVDVLIVNRNICASGFYGYGSAIKSDMICAAAYGKDSCQGDSGGPLVSDGVLVGIVSWGSGCALSRYPGVYSSVAHLHSWVVSNVNSI